MTITVDFSNLPSPVALTLAQAHRAEVIVLATALARDLNFGYVDFSMMVDGLIGSVAQLVDTMTGGPPSYLDRVPGAHRDGSCSPECDVFRDTRLTGPDAYSLRHDFECPNLPPEGD